MNNTASIVAKIWSYCNTLRDDGDYLVTYLLFLKMAHEYSQLPHNRDTHIPEQYNWESLRSLKALSKYQPAPFRDINWFPLADSFQSM